MTGDPLRERLVRIGIISDTHGYLDARIIDAFIGTGALDQIVAAVEGTNYPGGCLLPDPDVRTAQDEDAARVLSTSHMAYLKVAEGCSQHCTYCIIPKLLGKKRSRPLPEVISEARGLLEAGVKELVLVAQDTTSYGMDLKPEVSLSQLVESLANLPNDSSIKSGALVEDHDLANA